MAISMLDKSDFRDQITPHLAVLLRFSLWLTKDGRTATTLLRKSLAEAFRTWDVAAPDGSYLRLHTILIRRFQDRCDQTSHGGFSGSMENGGTNPAPGFPALSDVGVDLTGADWIASEKDNEANYLKTVAELPSVYRSAMMLSYLEDFSTSEIATPDSVGPYQDDSLSDRGRGVLHAQLYEHLMDTDGAAGQDDRNEASD